MRWWVAFLVVLLLGLQYRLWVGPGSWAQVSSLTSDISSQQTINAQLMERNRMLENEVRELKSGLESVEERARSELGLIRQGETFYLFVEKEEQ